MFILSNILFSIGDAGISGAQTVVLMNLLDDKNRIFDIGSMSKGYANILGGLLIGIVYKLNIRLPFLMSIVLLFINISFIFSIKNIAKNNKVKEENYEKEVVKNNLFFKNNNK